MADHDDQEQHFKRRSADVPVASRDDLVDSLITRRELHNTPLHESRAQLSPRDSGGNQR